MMKTTEAFSNSSPNLCLPNCPQNHMESPDDATVCLRCDSTCPKTCQIDKPIDSIREVQKFANCTIIDGNLRIEIKTGYDVMAQLERCLSSVEEIRGYLYIAHTPAAVSLSFLKNLRVVRGNQLHLEKYAIVSFFNENLQDLWDWDGRDKENSSLTIKNGMLYFHSNERLCYHKIEELKNRAGLRNISLQDSDVSRETNGDRTSCYVSSLTLKVLDVKATEVNLMWDKPDDTRLQLSDHRSLFAYTVFYMEV